MDIFLVPIGSAGDVHPFIGIGCELKRRGHSVAVLTNDHFKPLIERAGLEFIATQSAEVFKNAAEDPRLWHPIHGFEFVARHSFLPLIPVVYRALEERFVPGRTLVVGSSLAWGARVAQEKLGVPLVTIHLQPSIFISLDETPVYSGLAWVSRLPKILKKAYIAFIDHRTDSIVAPEVNRFRRALGLGPVRRILREWTHSTRKTIGLFPEWFAPPQADWPPRVSLTSFPLYDVDHIQTMPPEAEVFLKTGPAPIVFTAGSAMKQAREFFKVSAEACRRLGARGILVNQFPDQIPPDLPRDVIAVSYAPFSQLFPRAAVVVHHGGIGTTAQSLAAGVPQLVMPFAHDQFDNASRVVRLGLGEQISPRRYKLPAVTASLGRLLKDAAIRGRARQISARLKGIDAVSWACDHILEAI